MNIYMIRHLTLQDSGFKDVSIMLKIFQTTKSSHLRLKVCLHWIPT